MMSRSLAATGWTLAVVFSLGTVLAYSWAEGTWTGRWQPSDVSRLAAAKLKDIPTVIGAWEGTDGEFDERQLALGELDGYLHRIYTNRGNGQQVQLLVVCGRPGPISVHTPDVCYRGLGFTTLSRPLRKILAQSDETGESTCWTADFQKPSLGGKEYLRIAWTWFAAGSWNAADQPRFEFALEPVLFKAYLIHPVAKADTPWDEDSIPEFSKELFPVMSSYLEQRTTPSAELSEAAEQPPASSD